MAHIAPVARYRHSIMLSRAKNGHLHERSWWHRCGRYMHCISPCFSFAGDTSLIPVRIAFSMIGKFGITGTFAVIDLYTPEIFPTTLRYSHHSSVDTILPLPVCKYQKKIDTDGRIWSRSSF